MINASTSYIFTRHYENLASTNITWRDTYSERRLPYTDSVVTTGVRTWFVCRIMITIWEAREAYRYGEPDAITTIEPYLEEPHNWKRRIVDVCIYALCFGMHHRYREQLLLCHTERGFHISAFQKFLQGMLQEWAGALRIVSQI